MGFLERVKALRADKAPRILIYGPPKIGKTTLASEFPSPIFLQLEDGENETPTQGLNRAELQSFGDVMEAMRELYEGEHDYKTLVVDSMSELQTLIYAETCERGDEKGNKKARIEDFGYGKGYVNAVNVWQEFLDALNMLRIGKGMACILIAHAKVDRFDDPETVSYHRYEIDIHDRAQKLLEREMDAILLVKRDVTVKGEDVGPKKTRNHAEGSQVYICCEGKPSQVSGSRYSLPARTLYRKGEGYKALAPYFPTHQPEGKSK